MISCYDSTTTKNVSIPFDILLAIAFPLLFLAAWPTIIPTSIVIFLTVTHVIIAIYRYGYKKEIRWPVWADLFAIACGVLLSLTWLFEIIVVWKTIIFVLVGLFIIYGHGRKLLSPSMPYYYGGNATQLPGSQEDELSINKNPLHF
jgi:hypothetical protein